MQLLGNVLCKSHDIYKHESFYTCTVCVILLTVQAQVVSSYETSLEDELQLKVGDVVGDIFMTRTKYWSGNLNGKRGHFPKDCVKLLSEGLCATYV